MKKTVWLFTLFLLFSCAKKPPVITPYIEDNPTHHYLRGMELIDKGNVREADIHFTRSLELNKEYSPALIGKALATAITASKQGQREHKKIDEKKAFEYLKKSKESVEGDTEKFIHHITAMRVYTTTKPKKWIKKTKAHYEMVINLDNVHEGDLPYYRSKTARHYFMGVAYFKAYQFQKAKDLLSKALSDEPGIWHSPADRVYEKSQKIIRARGHYSLSDVSKKIAVLDRVTRADVATLIVDELHLNRLFNGPIPLRRQIPEDNFIPADALNHSFKDEITIVTRWNIRGLQTQYDATTRAYLFKPDSPVKRKELALILEDLLIKILGNEEMARTYFGTERSPFPDVPPTAAWFNSVVNATSRGLIEPDLSAEFRPDDYIDGAELLLSIMKLRNVLMNYLSFNLPFEIFGFAIAL